MLVLTRREGHTILIGPDIKITIVQVRGGAVRIGVDCPKEIPVVRGELTGQEPPRTEK